MKASITLMNMVLSGIGVRYAESELLTHAFHHGRGPLTACRELELAPRKMIRKLVAIFQISFRMHLYGLFALPSRRQCSRGSWKMIL